MIETPLVLWILIFGMIMPTIALATMGIRYAFFLNAARLAVHSAAQAKSFQKDFPPDLSAQTRAQQTAKTSCESFSGVTLNTVTTSIVVTPVAAGEPIAQTAKLAGPAFEENNLYQLQVKLDGQLNPLVPVPSGVVGINVPGLTAPYPVQTSAKEVSENPQGLNL